MAVTRKQMITLIMERVGGTRKQATDYMDATFGSLVKLFALSREREEQLRILGMGTFKKETTKPRKGRNPKTGAPIEIGPKVKLSFKMSSAIRKEWNNVG